jgi:hypothetical protein
MAATERELLAARIFFRAAFPVIKVILEEDPGTKKAFTKVQANVQFKAKKNGETIGAFLVFNKGDFSVQQGFCEKPDITLSFGTVKKMNAMLAGKNVVPGIKGLSKPILLAKVLKLLLKLKLMLPTARPSDPEKKRLKVKLVMYMITTALSQYNKGGDPEMVKWTKSQPDRIYQLSCEPEGIAAYVRVKAGNTKAGRGLYTRRRPFVHMKFHGVDGALKVMLRDAELVEAVEKGYISLDGSPEYAAMLNDFMQRIQAMVT